MLRPPAPLRSPHLILSLKCRHDPVKCSGICRARAKAALIGAFVADAATTPLHWIYDPSKVAGLVGGGDPEFFPTPSCPFYKYPVGDLSPYGAETLFLLSSVVEHGEVDVRPPHLFSLFITKEYDLKHATVAPSLSCPS